MTGNEYQRLASRTMNGDLDSEQTELHALHGMVSEMGEIHAIYQKVYQGHEWDLRHVEKEIGDLLWFIAELCTVLGLDLDDVMMTNIQKLIERYPEGFDADHSLHRKEGDI